MKRLTQLFIVLVLTLALIGAPLMVSVKADISQSYANGVRYNYHQNLTSGQGGFEQDITGHLSHIVNSIVEPEGFEESGGGELSAYIPMYYIVKNPNNNEFLLFDNFYITFNKIYENNQITIDDINLFFGKTSNYTFGFGAMRFNGLLNDCTGIQLDLDIYVPYMAQMQCFSFLYEFGYLDSIPTADFIALLSNSTINSDENFTDTLAFQNGVASVLENPLNYGLYTRSQLDNAENIAYNNGLNAGNGDLSDYNSFMSSTFNGLANLLSVNVFPHITIGLIIGIPLLLGLFLIIIKFIRG